MLLPEAYTLPQLREFLKVNLGGAVWRLEGLGDDQNNSLDNAISQALSAYSRRCPMQKFEIIRTLSTSTVYTLKTVTGYNGPSGAVPGTPIYTVQRVDFVYPSLTVSPFMASLVGVAPMLNLEGRDFALFLNWRKTFQRVTGIDPHWAWDEDSQQLRIHNPVHNAMAGVVMYVPRTFEQVRLIHKDWLRRASLAYAKQLLGEHRRKFSGKVPGPGNATIDLNGDKLCEEAKESLKDLGDELFKFQVKVVPVWD